MEANYARTDSNWIQTFTGRRFWPLDPRPEEIEIRDIAHALAMKCRFTGHTNYFYSVAQHSILASRHCPDPKWALMHDATEAYLPDVARPVKRQLPGFKEIEDRLMAVIAECFGLSMPMPECVHEIDLVLLATERRDLMSDPPVPWISTENVDPLPYMITTLSPQFAKSGFLLRFNELFGGDDA